MTTRARVRAVHVGNLVDVEFLPPARCRGCEGSCTWFRAPDAGELRLRAAVPVTVGQTVRVLLPGRYVLLGAVLLHGLPWGMLLLGAITGALIGGDDLSCLVGAALGFVGALAVTQGWHRQLETRTSGELRVVPTS